MRAPTLHGEMIVLRPIEHRDADAVWDAWNDPETRRLVGVTRPYVREAVERWIDDAAAAADRIDLAVTANGDDEYLGEISLLHVDTAVGSADVRLVMRPALRSRGYGTEAIQLMLGFAFGGLALHRVGAEVLAINTRVRSLYENLGFQPEGRRRDAHRDGEGWCDGVVMSMLDDEYRAGQPA
jgi:RimJ/RimL family protein N-acetyltransferase